MKFTRQTNQTKQQGSVKKAVFWAVILTFVAGFFVYSNIERLVDTATVIGFKPSARVASYIEATGMSGEGRFYYLASRPEIKQADEFTQLCHNEEPGSAILGCYVNRRIYVYDVKNTELAGIHEVTAAHEMMHAAYDRLSLNQQSAVNRLVDVEYEKRKNEARLASRVELYDKIEPGQRQKELYAIFATEVSDVGSDLELHYAKFFDDRSKVIDLYEKYSSVFEELERRGEELSQKMQQIAAQVESDKVSYEATSAALQRDIQRFNWRADNGSFLTAWQFNQERNNLLARSNQLDIFRQDINNKIDEYEVYRQELVEISVRSQELNTSIDSKLEAGPSL